MTQPNPIASIVDGFVDLIRPSREPRTGITENEEFLKMLWRFARALEYRTCEYPELIPQVIALVQRYAEIANVAIAVNAARYSNAPELGASMKECARLMGIDPGNASRRKKLGEATIMGRLMASNTVRMDTFRKQKEKNLTDEEAQRKADRAARLTEAKREGEAIANAAEFSVKILEAYRGRHRGKAA